MSIDTTIINEMDSFVRQYYLAQSDLLRVATDMAATEYVQERMKFNMDRYEVLLYYLEATGREYKPYEVLENGSKRK